MTEAAASGSLGLRVVVVGGSLVGLSMAIALARRGVAVTVLERTPSAGYEGGGGLGVDLDLLARVTGLTDRPPVCQGRDRATTAWPLLASWLEEHALAGPAIEIRRGTEVVKLGDGSARAADGRDFRADLVVGADGARSSVRRWVSPERPDAIYAGILLWRAMLAEDELPASVPWLRADEPSREYYSGPYRLVTYLVPGADGSSEPGRRRLNLVWYDPARSELLEDHGLLEGATIYGSLAASDVPEAIRHDLEAAASERWPTPWRQALEIALERSLVFATPVVQYRPDRLYRGRVALAGDAAHAASPMVGGGFRHGLYDVAALSAALANDGTPEVPRILDSYQQQRLASAQAHVEQSQAASQQYLKRQGRR